MTYRFSYDEASPYAHAVRLIGAHRRPEGRVVVDLGCGYGPIAEPLRSLGLDYVGVDSDRPGIEDLVARGFEGHVGDIASPGPLADQLSGVLAGRPVAAVCLLDALEHLADPDALLRSLAGMTGGATLVVSIPNVTHLDLGVKLLLGRWDVTETGLLDATHLRFFSEAGLEETMARCGWSEVGRADFELVLSDQHFPEDSVALDRATPVGSLLTWLRTSAGPAALVNQFVRAYAPGERTVDSAAEESERPFLSVLVRTQGTRPGTLEDTLLSLAAQTCADFEVLVLAHDAAPSALAGVEAAVAAFDPSFADRVRVVPVGGGGRARPLNEGARVARGHHLATLDDDDLAFAHWVETLKAAAGRAPGRVLHTGVAAQSIAEEDRAPGYRVAGPPHCPYPVAFEQLDHMVDNRTPNCGFAVPRSLVADLGQAWDDTLPVYEDWEYLLRATALCGVEDTGVVGALARVWERGERSTTAHDEAAWDDARVGVVARLDARPFLLAPGSVSKLRRLVAAADAGGGDWQAGVSESSHHATLAELAAARGELAALRASTSWRLTAPVRALADRLRRAGRRR
ncbi:MAG TPA: methyltransferase domain-containing protein [Acidimicrobiia bacterium]|nr:methyltransferase domain-containing protein [Acidimicrobiia bacterium]